MCDRQTRIEPFPVDFSVLVSHEPEAHDLTGDLTMVAPRTPSTATPRHDLMAPVRGPAAGNTLVGMNPLLHANVLHAKPVFDNRDTRATATMVAPHPLMLAPDVGAPVPQYPEADPRDTGPERPVTVPASPPVTRPVAPPLVRPSALAAVTTQPRVPTRSEPPAATAPVGAGMRLQVLGSHLGDAPALPHMTEGLDNESLEIGNKAGSAFADDPYVARYHAALVPGPDGVMLEDFGSINGVFLRVQGTTQLGEQARIRVGRQILSFEMLTPPPATQQTVRRLGSPDPGYWGRLGVMLDHERCAAVVAVRDATATVGQAATCGLSFTDDDRLAHVHCTLSRTDTGASISDGGSNSGVWVRVDSGTTIPYGAELLIGDTRVCIERT